VHASQTSLVTNRTVRICLQFAIFASTMASQISDPITRLQDSIIDSCKEQQQWLATLLFDVHFPREAETRSCDIMAFLTHGASYQHYFKDKIFFDKSKYKGPDDWESLLRDLQRAALDGGTVLISNGCTKTKTAREHKLVCNHFRLYKPPKSDKENDEKNYRSTSLHNDRANSRGKKGQSMDRRTTTHQPTTDEARCAMKITVMESPDGFYFVGGTGSACHANHYRLEKDQRTFPTRLIEKSERQIIESIGESLALNATGRNVHYNRCHHLLSRSQILYINKLNDEVKTCSDLPSGEVSDMDSLLHYFTKNGISYSFLDHSCKSGTGKLLVSNAEGHEGEFSVETVQLDDEEYMNMAVYAEERRAALGALDDQDIGIGVAWMLTEERRQFLLFPYVVQVDATSSTNKEGRPLLTVTIRDSRGKMITVLRVFLPNEQAWVFRWLFQIVFPHFLGQDCISRIQVIVTDGDSQEISQLDMAIERFFPQAQRVRCGWHIVDKGIKVSPSLV
jgi:hypothetical protein